MLLIVGDGIREGAAAITNFLESVGSLEFTFGLVEVALFRHAEVGLLVQPRILARTVELQRIVIELPEGARTVEPTSASDGDEALSERQLFYRGFWNEFLGELTLDDPLQPFANVTKSENIYFPMPPSGGTVWLSAYFSKTRGRVGVYLRFSTGNYGETVYRRLLDERHTIEAELGSEAYWREERLSIGVRQPHPDLFAPRERESIKRFFVENVNRFVNTFRPRLTSIASEMQPGT